MVYINETTFVMWDFPDIFEEMTGWFPVDEVIAPAVRELNLRGYRTTYSCSGHPVSGLIPVYSSEPEDSDAEPCGYYETFSLSLYVAFERDYGMGIITDLPNGVYMDDDNTVIRHKFSVVTGFPLLHERLEACEKLYQWTGTLPIIAPNRLLCPCR